MKRQVRIERIKAVEREYLAAKAAIRLLEQRLHSNPTFGLNSRWRSKDARNLRNNLEDTFLIRLYAEFEAGLRDAWLLAFHRPTEPRMRDLLHAIATRCYIPHDWLDRVHDVREYRNALIHEGKENRTPISIATARHYLCRFFSRLPADW